MEIRKFWIAATDAWKKINPSEFEEMNQFQKGISSFNEDVEQKVGYSQHKPLPDESQKQEVTIIDSGKDYTIDFYK